MGPEKAVYLLVVDGFADWEPAHAVAELRRHGQYRVESVGLTSATVESMGGIRVLPSTIVTNVDQADVAALILPGGAVLSVRLAWGFRRYLASGGRPGPPVGADSLRP
ncbi:MAG: DJ-1/PfpI family protein [Vicinamibacterales bacterium]